MYIWYTPHTHTQEQLLLLPVSLTKRGWARSCTEVQSTNRVYVDVFAAFETKQQQNVCSET